VTLGIIAFVQLIRGQANLGIDFAGGTSVQLKFEKPFQLDRARHALDINGFRDSELQQRLVETARGYGMRLLGPNCMGIYCPAVGLNTISPRTVLENATGPVAFIGQSGWTTGNFVREGLECGLRFSKVVSIGNQSDLTIEDFLNNISI
jgi:hypothetical protein